MLFYKQCKVCIFRLLCRIFITMSINRYNSVCIFIYYDSIRIHTESSDFIFKFFRTVYDLTLIKLIGKMGEDHGRKFYTHSDIHTVGFRRDLQILTYLLHPFTSASSHGNNTFLTFIFSVLSNHTVSVFFHLKTVYMTVKPELHFFF